MRKLAPRLAIVLAALLGCCAMTALAQTNYQAEINSTAGLLKQNPASETNRVRLATLYYLLGAQQAAGGKHTAAIETYRSGLNTLQEPSHTIARTNTAYQALWYGLGYSYRTTGQEERAIPVLEQLAAGFPKLLKGRYLLGLSQLESGSPAQMAKGVDTLAQLAKADAGGDGKAARRAALRWAYNYGCVLASEGKAKDAAQLMLKLNRTGLAEGAANPDEEAAVLYGAGYFKQQAGEYTDAIADLEALKDVKSDFKLRNGITLPAILANAYYAGGLQQVANTGAESLSLAVEYFGLAEKTGNPKAADVNYGKAVAYLRMGKGHELDVSHELELVAQKDPALYAKVNQAR